MRSEEDFNDKFMKMPGPTRPAERTLHPAWRAFIRYCAELKYGEIASLKIQDGVPVLAEVIREKIKFTT